jgi:hypothetical protein
MTVGVSFVVMDGSCRQCRDLDWVAGLQHSLLQAAPFPMTSADILFATFDERPQMSDLTCKAPPPIDKSINLNPLIVNNIGTVLNHYLALLTQFSDPAFAM